MNTKNEPLLNESTGLTKCAMNCLLMYWKNNPKASDTLEGICSWWIRNPEIQAESVHEALQRLCKEGVVQRLHAADGRIRYRLNQKQ